MPIQNASIGLAVALREDVADSSDLWDRLLLSAEQVLRGGEVEGPFASIADHVIRRRLASELMLGDRELDDGWRRMFLRHSCAKDPDIPAAVTHVVDFPEPPSYMRRDMEDVLARCWNRYLHFYSLDTTQRRNRHQAAAAFPFLVRLAVHVAHSEERWSRVKAAWRVIEAIDEGRPMIAALSEFLAVGKAEIRASRTMLPIDWHLDESWSEIRCLLRIVVLLPPDARPATSPDWSTIFRHLPLLVIVARVARAALSMALATIASRYAELSYLRIRTKVESRRMLVMLARDLRVRKISVERLSQLELPWLQKADADFWSLERCARIYLKSKQGWSLRSIVSLEELSLEGREMANCVARVHSRDLLLGHASFFSIRSADAIERLTMMVTSDLEAKTIEIALGGQGNQPATTSALRAATEMIDLIWPGIRLARVALN